MDLREYLFRKRITSKALAAKIPISRNYLGQVANKKVRPGIFLAKAIQEATNGEVTVAELLNTDKEENKESFPLSEN